jgi:prepilin-type processing-associated H-X9-DG protein
MKRKIGKWEIVMLLAALSPLALLVFNPFGGVAESWRWNPFVRAREGARRDSCLNNLKQIAIAMAQYQHDYDNKFPPAFVGGPGLVAGAASPYGWADNLYPYMKALGCNNCPTETSDSSLRELSPGYIDYWFNKNLSGRDAGKIKNTNSLLLLGDGGGGDNTNAAYSRNAIPPAWLTTPNSPARRHLGGANYVFADGHGRWIAAEKIKNFTFTPR